MNILITICARGGSKGVPNKNIRLINGVHLIGYSIKMAQELKEFFEGKHHVKIELSTDSEAIKTVASMYNLNTNYLRPSSLATDHASKIPVISSLLDFSEKENSISYDLILDLDVSSPLRSLNDLVEGFELINSNHAAINLFSVSPANRNPYFNMVELKDDGFVKLVKKLDNPFFTRDSAPEVFDMNASFYFYKKVFFLDNHITAITQKSLCFIMQHICFDIDDFEDLELMEYVMNKNKVQL